MSGATLATGLVVALAAGPPLSARQPALTLDVTTSARAMRPGEVVFVTIMPSRAIASVTVSAFGASSQPWTIAGLEWAALVGVPLTIRPGQHDVEIKATSADGASATATAPLTIASGQFATRRLKVDPQFASPPASAQARITRESEEMAAIFARVTPDRLWHGPFRVPVPGESTSSFGRISILNGQSRTRHQGADFRAAEGTLVRAPNGGRVVLSADYYFSGNTVILDHGGGLFSLFAHFSKILVDPGALLRTGDPIGESGATGRVTGPHVHWAVRLNGTSVDPLSLIAALAAAVE